MSIEKGTVKEREGKEIWTALENQEAIVQGLDEVISELEDRLRPLVPEHDQPLSEETYSAATEIGQRMCDVNFRMTRAQKRLANLLSNVQI